MHIDVIIPTYNRIKLLEKTVQSVKRQTHKDTSIIVVLDGNAALKNHVSRLPVTLLFNERRIDWIRSMNQGIALSMDNPETDAVLYASDDLVFPPKLIHRALVALVDKFPDGNGLIGINQSVKGCSSAFGLMGRKFIDHFPNHRVFCPDFIHYSSDFELGRYARNTNKFFFCTDAVLFHHRPKDETFRLAKKVRKRDYGVMAQRRAKGLIWGTTFELVTKR